MYEKNHRLLLIHVRKSTVRVGTRLGFIDLSDTDDPLGEIVCAGSNCGTSIFRIRYILSIYLDSRDFFWQDSKFPTERAGFRIGKEKDEIK